MTLSPSIDAARAEQGEGKCAYCEHTLPPGHSLVCARSACRIAHRRDYQRDWRRLRRGSVRVLPRRDEVKP